MHPPSNQLSNPSGDLAEAAEINKEDDDSIAKGLGFTIVAITLLLAGAAAVAYFSKDIPQSFKDVKKFGEIGDFIGGILNPIISGCTLFIAYAVWKLQKAELAATREELKESKQAMQEQAKIAEQQRSEQRFFDLLNIYQEVLKNCIHGEFFGKIALEKLTYKSDYFCHKHFIYGHHYNISSLPDISCLNQQEGGRNYWENFVSISNFKPYIRLIFSILDGSEKLLKDEHWYYAKLFRAQLGSGELALLTLSVLFDQKCRSRRNLIARYGILKHLPTGSLRIYAQQELDPLCFGRKWAAEQLVTPS